jgi:hypothetical protein
MVDRCDFVAFRVDIRLQSPIIQNCRELSSTLDWILGKNPVLFREKSGMKYKFRGKSGMFRENPCFSRKSTLSYYNYRCQTYFFLSDFNCRHHNVLNLLRLLVAQARYPLDVCNHCNVIKP